MIGLVPIACALALLQAPSQGAPGAAGALVKVTPNELLLSRPVDALAADGGRAAFAFCDEQVGVWKPGAGDVVRIGPGAQWTCPPPLPLLGRRIFGLALAGARVAWVDSGGGNQVSYLLKLADTGAPGAVSQLTSSSHSRGAPDPDPARLANVLGRGGLLVFSSREKCGDPGGTGAGCDDPPQVVRQTVWRVLGGPGQCRQPQGPCRQLASAAGILEPLSVDGGRVALRLGDGTIVVRSAAGGLVRAFRGLRGLAPAVELTGDDLVVLVRGELFSYSLATGKRSLVRQLPLVPFEGPCGTGSCVPVPLQLLDAARGLAAYRLGGKLYLADLAAGTDRAVATGTDARFGANGLFYVHAGAAPWPGRVRFVPWGELPLKPTR